MTEAIYYTMHTYLSVEATVLSPYFKCNTYIYSTFGGIRDYQNDNVKFNF